MNRCQIVITMSNLTVGVKHSICRRTFSPNLHSVEEGTLECLPILQHWYDFPTLYLKQAALDS